MPGICWISLDPRNNNIDIYPLYIASKIEQSYQNNEESLYLGKEFYDATIHFNYIYKDSNNSNIFIQKTKGNTCSRYSTKIPGLRSVKRIVIQNTNLPKYNFDIYYKIKNGLSTIVPNIKDSDYSVNFNITHDNIIHSEILNNYQNDLNIWKPEDLNNNNIENKFVIVWQWCRGTSENQGNIYNLDNSWWIPYLNDQNAIIEDSYQNKKHNVEIILNFDKSKRNIVFDQNSCYAKQYDLSGTKVRIIRRTLISFKDLKNKISINQSHNIENIIDYNNLPREIPNEFYCPITQCIMVDPVKTIDGHVYERNAIERWFNYNTTSPLTGLNLNSLSLESYHILKNYISNFKLRYPHLF